jgi:hypothetical protein
MMQMTPVGNTTGISIALPQIFAYAGAAIEYHIQENKKVPFKVGR